MNDPENTQQAFEQLSQEGRVARTARMLDPDQRLQENQRDDIIERFTRFIEEHNYTQAAVAREIGISKTTISDVIRKQYTGPKGDKQLARLHNWLELAARRENVIRSRKFVETSIAKDILHVAGIVAETCKIGVVFGPAQIGKTFTLKAIEGDQRFGDPVLFRVDESMLRPFPLVRAIADRFELSIHSTFDVILRRVIKRLLGTKRMLIFDEVERARYKTLETIRDIHDQTGCPILLCGKPTVYSKLGFRSLGDFSEVTDQLAARVVVRRDLTERTRRGKNPEPLFTLEDIRKLIQASDLKLHVEPDAVKWLQGRASSLGNGGIGKAMVCLYLAYKLTFVRGDQSITSNHLDAIENLSMGYEDAQRMKETIEASIGMRRVV